MPQRVCLRVCYARDSKGHFILHHDDSDILYMSVYVSVSVRVFHIRYVNVYLCASVLVYVYEYI